MTMVPHIYDPSFWLRITVSVICGLVIGAERQVRGKAVDIRTSILICLGTMLFIYLGLQIQGDTDHSRVLGQVVTGVGFLGAGVIMTRDGLVSGVTSAAVVWILAGIGAAVGFGYYDIAIVICLLTSIILLGMERFERIYKVFQRGTHSHKKED